MVKSPCNGLCRLDYDSRVCIGCGRTLREIHLWSSLTDEEKLAILNRLAPTPPPDKS